VTTARVLVIDDEPHMRDMLEMGLAQHGFEVRSTEDGRTALVLLESWRPDAIVLDLVMPKIDGMALLPLLRRASEAPVLMLSARKEVVDKIAALTAGADDYLGKPFDLGELAARLHSRLRRPTLSQRDTLSVAGLEMDLQTREARLEDADLALTTREFDLLAVLAREPGRVFTREQLIDRVWGYDAAVEPNVVESYVSYLRGKLESRTPRRLIHTVRRVGYTLRP
jgi:DNA-binding response OmpR family regulator